MKDRADADRIVLDFNAVALGAGTMFKDQSKEISKLAEKLRVAHEPQKQSPGGKPSRDGSAALPGPDDAAVLNTGISEKERGASFAAALARLNR